MGNQLSSVPEAEAVSRIHKLLEVVQPPQLASWDNWKNEIDGADVDIDSDSKKESTSPFVFDELIGRGRFIKTVRCATDIGPMIAKVYLDHAAISGQKRGRSLHKYTMRLAEIQESLSSIRSSNCMAYEQFGDTDQEVYAVRQFVHKSLRDRLISPPDLTRLEKRWLAFQLLKALEQCHSVGVCHGDIKPQNILLTSWDWLYLVDFADHKPVYLPADNPADYSYYYDEIGEKKTCCVAPERFESTIDRAGESGTRGLALNSSMDIFSAGCVIAEIFLERPLFSYVELTAYRRSEYDIDSLLSRVEDNDVRALIHSMVARRPSARPTCTELLRDNVGRVFPDFFESFIHPYCGEILSLTPDERIRRCVRDFDGFLSPAPSTLLDSVFSAGIGVIGSHFPVRGVNGGSNSTMSDSKDKDGDGERKKCRRKGKSKSKGNGNGNSRNTAKAKGKSKSKSKLDIVVNPFEGNSNTTTSPSSAPTMTVLKRAKQYLSYLRFTSTAVSGPEMGGGGLAATAEGWLAHMRRVSGGGGGELNTTLPLSLNPGVMNTNTNTTSNLGSASASRVHHSHSSVKPPLSPARPYQTRRKDGREGKEGRLSNAHVERSNSIGDSLMSGKKVVEREKEREGVEDKEKEKVEEKVEEKVKMKMKKKVELSVEVEDVEKAEEKEEDEEKEKEKEAKSNVVSNDSSNSVGVMHPPPTPNVGLERVVGFSVSSQQGSGSEGGGGSVGEGGSDIPIIIQSSRNRPPRPRHRNQRSLDLNSTVNSSLNETTATVSLDSVNLSEGDGVGEGEGMGETEYKNVAKFDLDDTYNHTRTHDHSASTIHMNMTMNMDESKLTIPPHTSTDSEGEGEGVDRDSARDGDVTFDILDDSTATQLMTHSRTHTNTNTDTSTVSPIPQSFTNTGMGVGGGGGGGIADSVSLPLSLGGLFMSSSVGVSAYDPGSRRRAGVGVSVGGDRHAYSSSVNTSAKNTVFGGGVQPSSIAGPGTHSHSHVKNKKDGTGTGMASTTTASTLFPIKEDDEFEGEKEKEKKENTFTEQDFDYEPEPMPKLRTRSMSLLSIEIEKAMEAVDEVDGTGVGTVSIGVGVNGSKSKSKQNGVSGSAGFESVSTSASVSLSASPSEYGDVGKKKVGEGMSESVSVSEHAVESQAQARAKARAKEAEKANELFIELKDEAELEETADPAAFFVRYPAETVLPVISTVTSALRVAQSAEAREAALLLLVRFSYGLRESVILSRLLPHVLYLVSDHESCVRSIALLSIPEILSSVTRMPKKEHKIFASYLLPSLGMIFRDSSQSVRAALSCIVPSLGSEAVRFLEMELAKSGEGEGDGEGVVESEGAKKRKGEKGKPKPSFDLQLDELRQAMLHIVSGILLENSSSQVKNILLTNVDRLCEFFGTKIVTAHLLPLLIHLLNQESPDIHISFYQNVSKVAGYVGRSATETLILPCVLGALSTIEDDKVIVALLECVALLCEKYVWSLESILETLHGIVPLLLHPRIWIRNAAITVITSSVKNMIHSDRESVVYVQIRPIIVPYINDHRSVLDFENDDVLAASLISPVNWFCFDKALRISEKLALETNPNRMFLVADDDNDDVDKDIELEVEKEVAQEEESRDRESQGDGEEKEKEGSHNGGGSSSDAPVHLSEFFNNDFFEGMLSNDIRDRLKLMSRYLIGVANAKTRRLLRDRDAQDGQGQGAGTQFISENSNSDGYGYGYGYIPSMDRIGSIGSIGSLGSSGNMNNLNLNTSITMNRSLNRSLNVNVYGNMNAESDEFKHLSEHGIPVRHSTTDPLSGDLLEPSSRMKYDRQFPDTDGDGEGDGNMLSSSKGKGNGDATYASHNQSSVLLDSQASDRISILTPTNVNGNANGTHNHNTLHPPNTTEVSVGISTSVGVGVGDDLNPNLSWGVGMGMGMGTMPLELSEAELIVGTIDQVLYSSPSPQRLLDARSYTHNRSESMSTTGSGSGSTSTLSVGDPTYARQPHSYTPSILSAHGPDPEVGQKRTLSLRRKKKVVDGNGNAKKNGKNKAMAKAKSVWRPLGVPVCSLKEHSDAVNRVDGSRNGSYFVTCSNDGSVRLWVSGECAERGSRAQYEPSSSISNTVNDVCLLEGTNETAACVCSDGRLVVLDLETSAKKASSSFIVGGREYSSGNKVTIEGLDVAQAWDIESGSADVVEPIGPRAPQVVVAATSGGTISCIDVRSRDISWTCEVPVHLGRPTAMTIGDAGLWMAVGTSRGFVKLWDLRFRVSALQWRHPSHAPINSLLQYFSTNRRVAFDSALGVARPLLAVAASSLVNEVSIWDCEKRKCVELFRAGSGEESPAAGQSGQNGSGQSQGQQSSVGSDDGITHSHVHGEVDKMKTTVYGVRALLAPRGLGGHCLLTGGTDSVVRYWDLHTAEDSFEVCGPQYSGLPGAPQAHTFVAQWRGSVFIHEQLELGLTSAMGVWLRHRIGKRAQTHVQPLLHPRARRLEREYGLTLPPAKDYSEYAASDSILDMAWMGSLSVPLLVMGTRDGSVDVWK